jgi:hypothetical protein
MHTHSDEIEEDIYGTNFDESINIDSPTKAEIAGGLLHDQI